MKHHLAVYIAFAEGHLGMLSNVEADLNRRIQDVERLSGIVPSISPAKDTDLLQRIFRVIKDFDCLYSSIHFTTYPFTPTLPELTRLVRSFTKVDINEDGEKNENKLALHTITSLVRFSQGRGFKPIPVVNLSNLYWWSLAL